jgi:hypothetical protein
MTRSETRNTHHATRLYFALFETSSFVTWYYCGKLLVSKQPQFRKDIVLSFQKSLPVITSMVIILIVAVLRERSRTVSAILSTMPINMVLALWLVVGAADVNPQTTVDFVRSLLVGLVPSFLWLVVIYVALRTGWSLLAAILAGYVVWGLLVALAFWLGILSANR